jgi:hypothetical protein
MSSIFDNISHPQILRFFWRPARLRATLAGWKIEVEHDE